MNFAQIFKRGLDIAEADQRYSGETDATDEHQPKVEKVVAVVDVMEQFQPHVTDVAEQYGIDLNNPKEAMWSGPGLLTDAEKKERAASGKIDFLPFQMVSAGSDIYPSNMNQVVPRTILVNEKDRVISRGINKVFQVSANDFSTTMLEDNGLRLVAVQDMPFGTTGIYVSYTLNRAGKRHYQIMTASNRDAASSFFSASNKDERTNFRDQFMLALEHSDMLKWFHERAQQIEINSMDIFWVVDQMRSSFPDDYTTRNSDARYMSVKLAVTVWPNMTVAIYHPCKVDDIDFLKNAPYAASLLLFCVPCNLGDQDGDCLNVAELRIVKVVSKIWENIESALSNKADIPLRVIRLLQYSSSSQAEISIHSDLDRGHRDGKNMTARLAQQYLCILMSWNPELVGRLAREHEHTLRFVEKEYGIYRTKLGNDRNYRAQNVHGFGFVFPFLDKSRVAAIKNRTRISFAEGLLHSQNQQCMSLYRVVSRLPTADCFWTVFIQEMKNIRCHVGKNDSELHLYAVGKYANGPLEGLRKYAIGLVHHAIQEEQKMKFHLLREYEKPNFSVSPEFRNRIDMKEEPNNDSLVKSETAPFLDNGSYFDDVASSEPLATKFVHGYGAYYDDEADYKVSSVPRVESEEFDIHAPQDDMIMD